MPLDYSDSAPQRRPGDFRRKGTDGPPYVASLTKTRQPKGNKAELIAKVQARCIDLTDFDFDNYDGNPSSCTVDQLREALGPEPADELYGRPSGFGDPLENSYALRKYVERQLVAGVIKLVRDYKIDPDRVDIDDQGVLDGLVKDAERAADAMIWADRGTHVHLLVERHERGQDWADLIPAGEALGIPRMLQARIVAQWFEFRAALGARSLACELTLVNDEMRIAGTTDLLDVFTDDLDLAVADTTYTVEAGQAVIGDVKTGELREKYAVQIVGYADAVPYDTEAEVRGEWPAKPHPNVGLIYHYDLRSALDGEVIDWRAVPVDLAVGRAGARICCEARDWPATSPFGDPIVVSVPHSADGQAAAVEPETADLNPKGSTAPAAATIADEGPATSPADVPSPAADEGAVRPPTTAPSSASSASVVTPRADVGSAGSGGNHAAATAPSGPAPSRRDALRERRIRMEANANDTGWGDQFRIEWARHGITPESTDDEIEAALDAIEPPFDPDPAPPHGIVRPAAATAADPDGDIVPDHVIGELVAAIAESDVRDIVNAWLAEANAVGRSFDPRTRSRERYVLITFAAFALALAVGALEDDEMTDRAREVLCAVIPLDRLTIAQPTIPIGAVLASLNIDEAAGVRGFAERLRQIAPVPTGAHVAAVLAAA